jgi:hypothetical protein
MFKKVKLEILDEIQKELKLKEKPIPENWLNDDLYEKAVDRLIGHNWAIKDMLAILIRLRNRYKKN